MPQTDGLLWGEAFEALLHHLHTDFIIIKTGKVRSLGFFFLFFLNCWHIRQPHLSEVTLFNEDCACEWYHVAASGLVGREIRHFHFGLEGKGTITGRVGAESYRGAYYKS